MKATAKEKQLLSDSIVNDRLEVVRLKARILELEEELRAGGLRRWERMSDVVPYDREKIISIAQRDRRLVIDKAKWVETCLNTLRGSAPTPERPEPGGDGSIADGIREGRIPVHPSHLPEDTPPPGLGLRQAARKFLDLYNDYSVGSAMVRSKAADALDAALARADVEAAKWERVRKIADRLAMLTQPVGTSTARIKGELSEALAALPAGKEGG